MESMHQEEIAPYFNTRDRLQAKVLVAAGEAAYRRAVQSNVKPGDRILEIGCHVGVTTEKLRLAVGESGTVIGIDASEISISRARTRFPEAHFVVNLENIVSVLCPLCPLSPLCPPCFW